MSRKLVITQAEGRWCTQQSFNGKRQAPVIRERSRRPRLAVKPSRLDWASRISLGVALCIGLIGRSLPAADVPAPLSMLLKNNCLDCHDGAAAEGGLDLASLAFTLDDRVLRDRWILIHDRVSAGEMPPEPTAMADGDRQSLVKALHDTIARADRADVLANGRGPLRRLNRDEYEQNLRDVLKLPLLDIRDMLPEDRPRRAAARPGRDHNKPLCNLFVTMLQYLGSEEDTFGSSTGTLNKVNS